MIYPFYVPVGQCFLNRIDDAIESGAEGQIEYFCPDLKAHVHTAVIDSCLNIPNKGVYIICKDQKMIRVDRLIKIFGTQGPAWNFYSQSIKENSRNDNTNGSRT